MLNRVALLPLLLLGTVETRPAHVVQLKEDAAITGRILTEKPDQIAIDVGYTVLVVPRSQIISISKPDEAKALADEAPAKGESSAAVASAPESKALFQTGSNGAPEHTVRELVALLGEGVVQVRTPGGLGSGFFLNEDGYLITNFHVIEGETQISVEVYHQAKGQLERKSYKDVRIVAMNKFEDITLLKVEDKDAPKFVPVRLGDMDALGVGERVFAIGSPLGLERTVTEGIVSTKTRQLQGELYLQTTTQVNPGNSGGPLFNLRGEVIGIINMKIPIGDGLGFAIPVDALKFFLRHRDAYAYDNDNPSSGYRYLEPPSRAVLNKPAS